MRESLLMILRLIRVIKPFVMFLLVDFIGFLLNIFVNPGVIKRLLII